MLLRRYLSLRNGGEAPAAGGLAPATGRTKRQPELLPSAPAEQHAVMASVVVLAERLGARVFGTGMQMLSCIRLVLEHEQPPGAVVGAGDTGTSTNEDGDGYVDAAARVARMEEVEGENTAAAASSADGGDFALGGGARTAESGGLDLGLGSSAEAAEDGDSGDTLCSVVLALLTTILELGEEERTAEEEAELRAMLGPLKVRQTTNHAA